MLTVTNKQLMLSVIMLNVVVLNVIVLSVVAPRLGITKVDYEHSVN